MKCNEYEYQYPACREDKRLPPPVHHGLPFLCFSVARGSPGRSMGSKSRISRFMRFTVWEKTFQWYSPRFPTWFSHSLWWPLHLPHVDPRGVPRHVPSSCGLRLKRVEVNHGISCWKFGGSNAFTHRGRWTSWISKILLKSLCNPGLVPLPRCRVFPTKCPGWWINFRNPVVCRHGSVPHENCHSGSGSFWGLRQTHQTWQTRCSKSRCLCAMFFRLQQRTEGQCVGTCLKFWDIPKMFCLLIIEKLRNVFLLPIMCSIWFRVSSKSFDIFRCTCSFQHLDYFPTIRIFNDYILYLWYNWKVSHPIILIVHKKKNNGFLIRWECIV